MRPTTPLALALAALLLPAAPAAAEPVPPPVAAQAAPAAAAPPAAPAAPARPAFEFETFQLVLLVRAPTWRKLPDAEAQALQARHLAHLERMGAAGKAVVCGPFGNQRDQSYRGACIYRVPTPDEARALAEEDPVVQAGQLRVEVVTWAVGKGYMTFPRAPPQAGPAGE